MGAHELVSNIDEARARWNPRDDASTTITDNGDGTYRVERVLHSEPRE